MLGLQLNATTKMLGSEIADSVAIQTSALMVEACVILVVGVIVRMENRSLLCLPSVIF